MNNLRIWLLLILASLVGVFAVLYSIRSNHCVLYYHGSAPAEVPQGTVVAILNPLRNRTDERNAEWLIRELRTTKCEEILRTERMADPARVCPIMRGNTEAKLIWLDRESDTIRGGTRQLIFDLPDKKARLIVSFGPDEPGWLLRGVSVVR